MAYAKPAKVQKGSGSAQSKSFKIAVIDLSDVDIDNWPSRDDGKIKMVGQIPFTAGTYITELEITNSLTSLPLTSEGGEDSRTVSSLPEFSHPGSSLEIEELEAHLFNKSVAVAVRVGTCGGEPPYWYIFGSPCAPLNWMPERENNNESNRHMIKFQQDTKSGIFPGRYYGTFQEATVNTVAADETTVDVTAGHGQYQLTDNTVATVITDLTNASAGTSYTLLGSGGTNPATIEASNTNFLLAGAVDWTGASGAQLTVEAFAQDGGDHVFIEVSRS